jgi:uncharacterized protein YukE
MIGRIIRIAKSIVRNLIKQITQQVNIIQTLVTYPIRAMISSVTGGIWKGNGADRFVAEMTSDIIPALTNIMDINTKFGGQIEKGLNLMEQAEQKAKGLAGQLFDVFSNIYK